MSDTRMTPVLFQQATIRRVWYHEEWFYSLNDVIAILTESKNPPAYWAKLKERLTSDGAQEGREYAILTNEISTGTFDIAIQQHKLVKLLPARANLRDHMTTLELAL